MQSSEKKEEIKKWQKETPRAERFAVDVGRDRGRFHSRSCLLNGTHPPVCVPELRIDTKNEPGGWSGMRGGLCARVTG